MPQPTPIDRLYKAVDDLSQVAVELSSVLDDLDRDPCPLYKRARCDGCEVKAPEENNPFHRIQESLSKMRGGRKGQNTSMKKRKLNK